MGTKHQHSNGQVVVILFIVQECTQFIFAKIIIHMSLIGDIYQAGWMRGTVQLKKGHCWSCPFPFRGCG